MTGFDSRRYGLRPDRTPAARPEAQAFHVQNVLQGETRISNDPQLMMTTLLGSCVAACLWDDEAAVGGMNHFLLPGDSGDTTGNLRYGVNAMELLVNGLIKQGARREHLQVKLFGGAKMFKGGKEIGRKNVEFARWFMRSEGLPVSMHCLGGQLGRKIRFWPATGRAQRMFMDDATQLPQTERGPVPLRPKTPDDSGGDIELF